MVNRFWFRKNFLFLLVNTSTCWARNYSKLQTPRRSVENFQLDPAPRGAVTGFCDGESCFYVNIKRNNKMKIGWAVEPRFQIGLHNKNNAILEQISKFFGVGKIYKQGPELLQWKVQSFSELERVIKHFNKFSLRTKKLADLKLFIMVYEIMRRKEHLTENGLCKIVAIRAAMSPSGARFIRCFEKSLSRCNTCS